MKMSSSPKTYSLQVAERINNVTGKNQLGLICTSGLFLESLWHSVVERRFMRTPPPVLRKAMIRAAITWPILYVATAMALRWAERRVRMAEEEGSRNEGVS